MSEPKVSTDPTSFNTPAYDCLSADQIDNVGRALISLLREVTVLNDRVMVLESFLEQQGVTSLEAIDTFQPDEAFAKRSREAMGRIIEPVIDSLRGADQ